MQERGEEGEPLDSFIQNLVFKKLTKLFLGLMPVS